MNEILKELIIGRYKLSKENENYQSKADYLEIISLINLLEKRENGLEKEFEEIKKEIENK